MQLSIKHLFHLHSLYSHEFSLHISGCIEVTEHCLNLLSGVQCSCWAITPAPTESEVTTASKKANILCPRWLQLDDSFSALVRWELRRGWWDKLVFINCTETFRAVFTEQVSEHRLFRYPLFSSLFDSKQSKLNIRSSKRLSAKSTQGDSCMSKQGGCGVKMTSFAA